MADASSEDFDQAIEEAKAEGNLSRANLVRKVKGETLEDKRDARRRALGSKFFDAVIKEAEAVMKAAAENPEAFGDLDERMDMSGEVQGLGDEMKNRQDGQPVVDDANPWSRHSTAGHPKLTVDETLSRCIENVYSASSVMSVLEWERASPERAGEFVKTLEIIRRCIIRSIQSIPQATGTKEIRQ